MIERPVEHQHRMLNNLVKKGTHTEWGKRHNFKGIRSYNQFSTQVPLQNYEEMVPYITRIRDGEQNVMWPTEIKWFAKSSGTASGKSKFIPVSYESIQDTHFAGGKDLLALYTRLKPDTKMFTGMSLRLGGSTAVNSKNHETYYGDLSAVLIENFPFWVEIRSTPNQRTALMDEWESKINLIAKEAIKQNVTSLWGVNSWFLVLLHKVLEMTGKTSILDVWPNLELFAHGGVSFEPYAEQFRQIIPGSQVTYLENYNASEGHFSIQDSVEGEGMLLMLDHGIFYEFIPMHAFNGTASEAIPLEDVKLGENYAMVITTNAGLWRYIIGDTVRFVSKNPYRITISGRTKNFINAFGEEVIVDNAEKAMRKACEETLAEVLEYHAAPVYMKGKNSGAHEWIGEFKKQPKDLARFIYALDTALKEINSDYEAKRHKSMALKEPIVHIGRKDVFHDWLKFKGKLGGQNKIPRLMNDRSMMDDLIRLNAK